MNTDKQSTALQQLIQWLDPIHDSVIKKATELLEVEKRQIFDSYNQGYRDGEDAGKSGLDEGLHDVEKYDDANNYFINTFKQ